GILPCSPVLGLDDFSILPVDLGLTDDDLVAEEFANSLRRWNLERHGRFLHVLVVGMLGHPLLWTRTRCVRRLYRQRVESEPCLSPVPSLMSSRPQPP